MRETKRGDKKKESVMEWDIRKEELGEGKIGIKDKQ